MFPILKVNYIHLESIDSLSKPKSVFYANTPVGQVIGHGKRISFGTTLQQSSQVCLEVDPSLVISDTFTTFDFINRYIFLI